MSVTRFRRAMRESPALRSVVSRYLFVVITQLSQSTACTRFHEVEARLARWLLMTHDRAHADRFHLTHLFLANMLGVRRSAVTIAAGALQRRNLIRYARGEIAVVDRQGLEAASCECYQKVIADYRRMFD
jgi:CRP-like cAMP-binding protein